MSQTGQKQSNQSRPGQEKIETGPILARMLGKFQTSKRPLVVNFRNLLPDLKAADRFTHLIHPYPAKLLGHIPYFFLSNEILSKPGDRILDPFCGSGTVLLEAILAGREAYGADSNPLARLIARVKTDPLDPKVLTAHLNRILLRIRVQPGGRAPDVVNLEHWFHPHTVRQLRCLRESIDQVRSQSIRNFFQVCFSVCVRKVSLADPRLSVPVRMRIGQYPENHPFCESSDSHVRRLRRTQVSKVFAQIAIANISRMERFFTHENLSCGNLLCSDAQDLRYEHQSNNKIPDNFFQMIITSPPYPGAQKYIRSSSLSLGWLGLCCTTEMRELKSRSIGREEFTKAQCGYLPITGVPEADSALRKIFKKNPVRAVIAATYLNEMRNSIREMHRVLKPGGTVVLVVANNRVTGRQFRTVRYLQAIAEQSGLTLVGCFIDAIRSRGLMTKRNATASIITREWVLLLTKELEWTR